MRDQPESESPSPADLQKRQRAFLAVDLASILAWTRGLMTPEQWTGVSQAMALLTGQSLEQRLSSIYSAVMELPTWELTALVVLFRDVGADLAAGRGHRPLTHDETIVLEDLRAILAGV